MLLGGVRAGLTGGSLAVRRRGPRPPAARGAKTRLAGRNWMTIYLGRLTRALERKLKVPVNWVGPAGICARCFVEAEGRGYLAIETAGLDEGEFVIRDYTKRDGNFREGTVGAINGMNFARVEVPYDATLQWFIDQLSVR